jgi:Fe-S oxidoreductase
MATSESVPLRLEALKKEVYSCTRCGFCRVWDWKGVNWVCPTYPYTESWDTQYARGRVSLTQQFMEEGTAQVSETFLKHLTQCSLCGSCAVHCPVGMPLFEIFQAFRSDLVDAGLVYAPHQRVVDNITQYRSIFAPRSGAGAEHHAQPRKVHVLYFPGCQTNRKARGIGKATTDLLTKLHVDFAVLEEDSCCGYPLYDIGQMEAMRANGVKTVAAIEAYQPDIVLTTCAGCYRALKYVYPEVLKLPLSSPVLHAHDYFPALLPGKMQAISRKVTYHDPCILGRHMGQYDAPRAMINSVPGVELIEMYSTREHALCCGGGGGVLGAHDEIAAQVAVERLQQAAGAGAEQLVTSCPTCVVNLKRAVSKAGVNLVVNDIVELLNEAVSDD